MSKIQDKFKELKSKNEKALISYIMAGFPNENATLSIVRGLVKGGADIIPSLIKNWIPSRNAESGI